MKTTTLLTKKSLTGKPWWDYIETDLQELLRESQLLLKYVKQWEEKFDDYAFIVFPAAKAYEGFLKKLFLDLQFITEDDYFGRKFRIGKVLNPALDRERYKDESVYDKLTTYCQGDGLANQLWETWRVCRNLLFHWFPDERNFISYKEARMRVELIISTIDQAFEGCKVNNNKD